MAGRPTANVSFALNYALGGLDVRGYHLVNIGIHALTALLVFHVLRQSFARRAARRLPSGDPPAADTFGVSLGSADALAFAVALVWAVHPLNSEVVNYLAERTESLMGFFYLLSLSCAIAALTSRRTVLWELGAVAATMCAVTSKEPGITVPIAIFLWDRLFVFSSWRSAWAGRSRLYLLTTAVGVIFAVALRMVPEAGYDASSWEYLMNRANDLDVSAWTYLMNEAPTITRYFALSFWPSRLILDYGFALPLGFLDVWPSLALVSALLAATVVALRVNPLVGFWSAWVFLNLAPTSSVLPIAGEVGAERRMYLPLVGVVALTVIGVDAVSRRFAHFRFVRPLMWGGVAVVALVLASATVIRNRDYQSSVAIWQTSVERRPHWRSHENLSQALRDAGRVDEQIVHLRQAAPFSPNSQHALAGALVERGQINDGIVEYRRFIKTYPDHPRVPLARRELARALSVAGDKASAIAELRDLVRTRPSDVRSGLELATLLEASGDSAEAAATYRSTLAIDPNNVIALSRLGNLLALRGDTAEATVLLVRAASIEPRSTEIRRLLTQLLVASEKYVDAERSARDLIAMASGDPEAHNLLGIALASQQRPTEALGEFDTALSLNPAYEQARANRRRIEQRLGGQSGR